MRPTTSRRAFIRSAIGAVAAMAFAGCGPKDLAGTTGAPLTPSGDAMPSESITDQFGDGDPVIALLQQKFNYLQLEPAGLIAFAQDFQERAGKKLLGQRESDPGQFEYAVGSQYLMSTDFFRNGADESRPVKYTGYYDIYNGCTSPFAKFD
jgi:hypothetical protein